MLDPHCRCWDVPNLYVTDGACWPTSGWQNPTLTEMAVTAARLRPRGSGAQALGIARGFQKRCQNSDAYEGTASRQKRIFFPSAKPRAT